MQGTIIFGLSIESFNVFGCKVKHFPAEKQESPEIFYFPALTYLLYITRALGLKLTIFT